MTVSRWLARRVQQSSPLRRGSGWESLRGGLRELPGTEVRAETRRGSAAPDAAGLRVNPPEGALEEKTETEYGGPLLGLFPKAKVRTCRLL